MKNTKITFIVLILITMMSCIKKQRFQIEFDNVNGLKEKAKVVYKSQTIGEVIKIGLNEERKVITDIYIDKDFILPDNFKFVMISLDVFGTRAIEIREENNDVNRNKEQIIKGEIEDSHFIDSISDQVINVLENAALNQSAKQDTILIELRRLNDNLEDLKSKK